MFPVSEKLKKLTFTDQVNMMNRAIGLISRLFANGLGDGGSILGRVIL